MLTLRWLHRQDAAQNGTAFLSEAVAHGADGTLHPLGRRSAGTPRLALRWLRSRAQDIAEQLDARAALPLWEWLGDHDAQELALHYLSQGDPYTVTTYEGTARYILTARPAGHRSTP